MKPEHHPLADRALSNRYLAWRHEKSGDRQTKIPINVMTGRRAKVDCADTWTTRADVEAFSGKKSGVGIVLGDLEDGRALAGVDLDSCLDPATGRLEPWARRVVDTLDSYTEISPSGEGMKIFFLIDADHGLRGGRFVQGGREGDHHPPAIEVYFGKRFFTVTDRDVGRRSLRHVSSDNVRAVLTEGRQLARKEDSGDERFACSLVGVSRAAPLELTQKQIRTVLNALPDAWCENYDEWLRVGMALHHEYRGSEEGLEEWEAFSSVSAKFDDREIAGKWQSFGTNENPVTMRTLIAEAGIQPSAIAGLKPENRGLRFFDAGTFDNLSASFDFIPDTLYDGSVAIIYGPPQSGKTFFALHLLCSTALGRRLFGVQPESRRGLYIGLEGEAGIKARIQAWCVQNEVLENPIAYALGSFDIADADQRAILIDYIKSRRIQFVVIDTLARTMTGLDEIAGRDMSVVIDGLHEIKGKTGACVVAITHTGKEVAAGIRGHSSQVGNVDTTIEVKAVNDTKNFLTETPRVAYVRKQRDGKSGTAFHFRLTAHDTDTKNARDDVVRSVALEECEHFRSDMAACGKKNATRFSAREQIAVTILEELRKQYRRIGTPTVAQFRKALKREDWGPPKPSSWRSAFDRLLDKLPVNDANEIEALT